MINFISTWNEFPKYYIEFPRYYIFVDILLIKDQIQGALRKVLIAPFIERFKTATLESLTDKFCQYLGAKLLNTAFLSIFY